MRHDRIFPLADAASYPGSLTLDMVFFVPKTEGSPRRLWLMTPAERPKVAIDDEVFEPRAVYDGPPRWIDLGVTERLSGGFGQLRIEGISPAEAEESFLVVTAQVEKVLHGGIEKVERQLWGIARRDAGRTTITPSRVTVGEPVCFIVRYEVSDKGLPPGSYVRFAVPLVFSTPQAKDPDGPGGVRCWSSDAPVSIFSIERSEESHEAVDIVCFLEEGLPSLSSFSLSYRTERTYLFPCRFHQIERRYWYSKLPPLAAAVAVDDRMLFVPLQEEAGHQVEFVAGRAERLHLFLPGRRKAGGRFLLRGVFTDRYRNVPPTGPVHARVHLVLVGNGKEIDLGTPERRFVAGHRFEVPLPELPPGVYRAFARDADTSEIVAESNPFKVLPEESEEPVLYWGEIHGHCEMSDGSGSLYEMYRHAKEEGCLDFAASADHACYFTDNQWLWMQDVTNFWNRPGEFVTLIGYEWSGKQVDRNIYTYRDRLELFRGMYAPTSSIDVVWRHFRGREDVVAGPHHTLHGVAWEHHEPTVERFAEIYSMWGASDSPENPLAVVRRTERSISVNEILNSGAKLGFTGGGDCHEGHCGFSSEDPKRQGKVPHGFATVVPYRCGMTAAFMESFDRHSLIRALRERKTYATTGARILLSFSVSGISMGDEGEVESAIIEASVHGCGQLEALEVVKNGRVVHRLESSERDVSLRWRDPEPLTGENWYYLKVLQADGQMAWSSPIWVRRL